MARTVGSNGVKTMEAIRQAGLQLIHEHGFEAMGLRDLAAAVGLRVGSLYNHISTKEDLLVDLIRTHMNSLFQELDQALVGIDDPVEKLQRFILFHVTYHIVRKREVFIGYSELRSLEPEHYREIVGLRRDYEQVLVAILEQGRLAGRFQMGDVQVAAFGILAMLTGVCTWFRPDGRLSREDVVAVYSDMILKGLLVQNPDGGSPSGALPTA